MATSKTADYGQMLLNGVDNFTATGDRSVWFLYTRLTSSQIPNQYNFRPIIPNLLIQLSRATSLVLHIRFIKLSAKPTIH
jgi:hypothetical protein